MINALRTFISDMPYSVECLIAQEGKFVMLVIGEDW